VGNLFWVVEERIQGKAAEAIPLHLLSGSADDSFATSFA
jgi:hypothetical protein